MQKVGACLNKNELARKVIMDMGGLSKTSDFVLAGLKNDEVAALCKAGVIERIRRGFYRLPQGDPVTDEQIIKEMIPQGIICMESALFHYEYSDFSPREWSVAVPRTASRIIKRMREVPIKAYFVQKDLFELGKITDDFGGVSLAVYDRERVLCDCFKYRTKLDNELFNKAVNAYAVDGKKNIVNLTRYAKKMKLYSKIMNVMEVLLNG